MKQPKVEIGTKVTCAYRGHGVVSQIRLPSGSTYPVIVNFKCGKMDQYTLDLKLHHTDIHGLQLGHLKTFKQRIVPNKDKIQEFRVGDEVIADDGKVVLVTCQRTGLKSFAGVVLEQACQYHYKGYYSQLWVRKFFKLHKRK